MKIERRSIHAIAQTGRLRAVVKDVTEMAAAPAAMHFGASHKQTAVGLRFDRLLDRRRETRPTGSTIELGVGGEQGLTATSTVIDALPVLLVEWARTGAFGTVLAQYLVLRRREPAAPLFVAQLDPEFLCRRVFSAAEATQ
jgi:hypothetical protein